MKVLVATCTHQLHVLAWAFPLRFSYFYFQSFREQARAQVLEFKLQETELGRDNKDFELWDASDEDAYKQWDKKYGASARELGYSRSIAVDAASKMRE